MIKYYCDNCGKEVSALEEIAVPNKKLDNGSFYVKKINVCKDCEKKAKTIESKLVDIRFILYSDFMTERESNAE